jgi:hypothetical protein
MLYAKLLMERLSGKDLDPCHVHSCRCLWIRQRPSTHSIKLRQDQQLRHVSGRLSELLGHKYEILPPDLSRFELLPRHRPTAGGPSRNRNRNQTRGNAVDEDLRPQK